MSDDPQDSQAEDADSAERAFALQNAAFLLQLFTLATAFVLGLGIKHLKIHWIHEAGATILLGVLVGLMISGSPDEITSLSSVFLLFFSKNSLFSGCSFSSILVWQILFYLLAHYCVYISSFEKRIRRREEQTRSRDKTHDRRPARLKRNARSVLLCRALLLYLLSVFASRETRKEELKRENCL